MLTFSTVFISLFALHALLASTGQGQVEANVLRRATAGHSGRQSHIIRGLLNIPGRDESFQRRQSSCKIGFYPCSDGVGCCPNGKTCDYLKDGSPTCCCFIGGNCPSGELPCSANEAVCCPNGDLCSSDGSCSSSGSSGGVGGTGGGSGGSSSTASSSKAPGTTSSPLVLSTLTVTATPPGPTGSFGTGNGEVGIRAGTAVVMMGSILVAARLALLIL